jgi:hypothetical protein
MTNLEDLKENLLKLAEQHKIECGDPECSISTTMIGELLLKAGCELTSEEWRRIL